ncbi:serine/threonine-protein kinase [Streptomyces echinatus]|uniref:serine/threonine-protein kinase n=1 Tax=Streptomyces echinatus TaxID=67293 RepID=UPI00378D2258
MDALKPQDPPHIGTHALLARLGAGGMGQVYLGRSPGGRLVAIKVIRDEITDHPEALARFRREVETAATVRSAYTANLIDASLDAAPYWLATEYVAGPTLAGAVTRRGPLPAETCRGLCAALAEGLAAVHAHGVTHRDLKPQNVILAAQGPQLIDFGIARGAGHAALTDTGRAPGTPGYTAPEVLLRNEVGPPADVFALGATLAFAATGRAPFGAGDPSGVGYRAVHEPVDVAGVEPELAALIEACAAKDPAARPGLAEVIARCGVRTALVEDPHYAGLGTLGEAVPQVPPPPAGRPAGLHALPTVGPASYGGSGRVPAPAVQPANRARGGRWAVAVAAGLAVGVAAGAVVVLAQRGDGADTARSGAQGRVSSGPKRTASGPGATASSPAGGTGVPAYAEMKLDRTLFDAAAGQCQVPAEERGSDGFMMAVENPDDPDDQAGVLSLDHKVKIGFRDKYAFGKKEPYYVTVSVKPPHDIDPDTGRPVAGLLTADVSSGYTSKPLDLYGGADQGDWKYVTYPDDFRQWVRGRPYPAVPLTNDPGDWTVQWHHIRTPGDYRSIMCAGFTVK